MTANQFYKTYKSEIDSLSGQLGVPPKWLLAIMEFETGGQFSTDTQNAAGSGAVGLIQFTPYTANLLGTTTAQLKLMTVPQQLEYVKAYFLLPGNQPPYTNVGDMYLAVFSPAYRSKPDGYIAYKADTLAYTQNVGLDKNKDGSITVAEIKYPVQRAYDSISIDIPLTNTAVSLPPLPYKESAISGDWIFWLLLTAGIAGLIIQQFYK
ncbi:hypothetical protein C7N43_34675 [Sphingobacteriales bacterium UPWRP_1]|nr:hypothetical protein C7N43_34675 [Sphingobacteriales bacterium UPWRP_1]